jgi:alcohol dehydrogenase class IV
MTDNVVTFQIPTQIVFGVGSIQRIPEYVKLQDHSKALLVTDRGVRNAGLLNQVISVLDTHQIPFVLFDQTEANPSVETVEAATALLCSEHCTTVIGLGGGSPMDVAKMSGVMATNPGSVSDYEGAGKIKIAPVPIIAIPTTAGTGSEVTPFIVITDTARRYKMTISSPYAIPAVAIVDPAMMTTMPPNVTAATGMDALTHGIESYVSIFAQPFSEALALHGIKLVSANLRKGVANRSNMEAMSQLAIASTMVATAFSCTRLGNGHAMSHPLSGFYNIPHGVANAVLLPYIMEYNALACPEKMTYIAQAMGVDVVGLSLRQGAVAAVEAVRDLMRDVGIPAKLGPMGLKEEDIVALTADAMKSGNVLANPRHTTPDDIMMLYRTAM